MQDLALAMDDANYNIYQIRELVEAQNEEERKLYSMFKVLVKLNDSVLFFFYGYSL